jgi:DUF4097 and DUF4098 domain-containing protein YvlB
MSEEQIVSGGGLTRLEVGRAEGELEVMGWDESHIRIVGLDEDEAIPAMDAGGVLRLARLREDVTISLPRSASLHVLSAKEDVSVRGLLNTVRLDSVSGDVTIQDVGAVLLGAISGDAHLERCQGGVRADSISGDVVARNLGGLEITSGLKGDIEVQDAGEVNLKSMNNGDARISRVGRITIANMHGDCGIAQVGSVEIGNLSGDLSVQDVESVCQISNMSGDAHLRNCGGVVMVENLSGDLTAQEMRGGIGVGNVTGDVTLDTPLAKGATYTVHASGDISLRVRGEIHARFVAQTLGGSIQTSLPLTVERGRRRHLVGAIGRAEATVTLQSEKGDISITAADRVQEKAMSDDFGDDFGYREEVGAGSGFGGEVHFGRGFGLRWDKGPGRFSFMTGYGHDDPDGPGDPRLHRERERSRGKWPFDWDDKQRADYERRIREMSEHAARRAREAAERATEYAERAARRARETDWESVGREVRSSIERAMGEMEHLWEQFRFGSGASTPRPPHPPTPPRPPRTPTPPTPQGFRAQRVPIERDEDPDGTGAAAPEGRNKDELDAARRAILEQLRSGTISMDEAERQLDALR